MSHDLLTFPATKAQKPMTQNEARHLVVELIRDHDIKDEILVGLFMGRVKRAVWERNGGYDAKLEDRLNPDVVAEFLDVAVNSIANEVLNILGKRN
jgi:hypothetical protein